MKETSQINQDRQLQVVVFRLGNEEYALLIEQIKEVVPIPPVTKVPLLPSYFKGVANVRGEVLAIIDLEEKFELQKSDKVANFCLVIESKAYKMAIMVKDIPNTLNIFESEIDHSPNLIQEFVGQKNYIKGIIKTEEKLLVLIDIFRIVENDSENIVNT